jgi:hypothetical protein
LYIDKFKILEESGCLIAELRDVPGVAARAGACEDAVPYEQ